MLWRIAIHNRLIHPDFVRPLITDKQFHEIAWYHEHYPFGHDIDHLMMARIAARFSGESEQSLLPTLKQEIDDPDDENFIHQFPGAAEFLRSIENGDH